jgi:hypothetical protein
VPKQKRQMESAKPVSLRRWAKSLWKKQCCEAMHSSGLHIEAFGAVPQVMQQNDWRMVNFDRRLTFLWEGVDVA